MSNFNSTVTQEGLTSRLFYDQTYGVFSWVKACRGIKVTDKVGVISVHGYHVIMINKRNYFAHRLAWLYVYGELPKKFIDHINGVKTDNRIANLREVNKSENGQNIKSARSDSTSGLLGAYRHGKNWRSQIQLNGKVHRLGMFKTADLAHEAYIKAKRVMHPMGML